LRRHRAFFRRRAWECALSLAIMRATLSIADKSAPPDSRGGVPTQMKITSAERMASAASAVKRSRPERRAAASMGLDLRLVDRYAAGFENRDFCGVVVGGDDLMADFGQTSARSRVPRIRSRLPQAFMLSPLRVESGAAAPIGSHWTFSLTARGGQRQNLRPRDAT